MEKGEIIEWIVENKRTLIVRRKLLQGDNARMEQAVLFADNEIQEENVDYLTQYR